MNLNTLDFYSNNNAVQEISNWSNILYKDNNIILKLFPSILDENSIYVIKNATYIQDNILRVILRYLFFLGFLIVDVSEWKINEKFILTHSKNNTGIYDITTHSIISSMLNFLNIAKLNNMLLIILICICKGLHIDPRLKTLIKKYNSLKYWMNFSDDLKQYQDIYNIDSMSIKERKIRGLKYCGNSCYQDSVFMSLFACSNDIITKHILEKNVSEISEPKWIICNKDPIKDRKIKISIQNELNNIKKSIRGEELIRTTCSNLRTILNNCKGNQSFNLKGQQDASDFISYLFNIFQVDIAISTRKTKLSNDKEHWINSYEDINKNDSPIVLIETSELIQKFYTNINLADKINVSWISTLDVNNLYKYNGNLYKYTKNTTTIESPYIIFQVSRKNKVNFGFGSNDEEYDEYKHAKYSSDKKYTKYYETETTPETIAKAEEYMKTLKSQQEKQKQLEISMIENENKKLLEAEQQMRKEIFDWEQTYGIISNIDISDNVLDQKYKYIRHQKKQIKLEETKAKARKYAEELDKKLSILNNFRKSTQKRKIDGPNKQSEKLFSISETKKKPKETKDEERLINKQNVEKIFNAKQRLNIDNKSEIPDIYDNTEFLKVNKHPLEFKQVEPAEKRKHIKKDKKDKGVELINITFEKSKDQQWQEGCKQLVDQKGESKTQLCKSIIKKVKCKHQNKCNFAHTIDEFIPTTCYFKDGCKHVKKVNESFIQKPNKKLCYFLHNGETKESLCRRIGLEILDKEKPEIIYEPKLTSKDFPDLPNKSNLSKKSKDLFKPASKNDLSKISKQKFLSTIIISPETINNLKLSAIVIHNGLNHYTCYFKCQNKWFYYDDSPGKKTYSISLIGNYQKLFGENNKFPNPQKFGTIYFYT